MIGGKIFRFMPKVPFPITGSSISGFAKSFRYGCLFLREAQFGIGKINTGVYPGTDR